MMHKTQTTLLHSLEGIDGAKIDWEKILKLQSKDGSFLCSPSSTAYALIQTGDLKCLEYLDRTVKRCGGGVPYTYPVDMWERIWVVDRLQRLGICRYFLVEIEDILNYVNRNFTKRGIGWSRHIDLPDLDDTAMGFRLLRLHGYEVLTDIFKNFMQDGVFICFFGESTSTVTPIYNLNRASQLQFPRGEDVLEEARSYSFKFLKEKQASNQLLDKWVIPKDLPGEIRYALEIPMYADLPRVQHRFYIDQYGGWDDVWIGKTLFRMPLISNNEYLEMAKLDFNNCQSLHRLEWDNIQSWYAEHKLGQFGLPKRSLLQAYFLAAASIFEPENSIKRIAWAKTTALIETITLYFGKLPENTSEEDRKAFTQGFRMSSFSGRGQGHAHDVIDGSWGPQMIKARVNLMTALLVTIDRLSFEVLVAHGDDIRLQLHEAWKKWLTTWEVEEDRCKWEAGLLAITIHLCSSNWAEILYHPRYQQLMNITNKICHQLGHLQIQELKCTHNGVNQGINNPEVESSMQALLEIVLRRYYNDLDRDTKQTFLTIAKTFYYAAHCSPETIDTHISKVLFEAVE